MTKLKHLVVDDHDEALMYADEFVWKDSVNLSAAEREMFEDAEDTALQPWMRKNGRVAQ